MKSPRLLLLAPALWLCCAPLQAHTELTASKPADGAVLRIAPAELDLAFPAPVKLLKLNIVDDTGAKVETGFKASPDAQSVFATELPKLKPATYKASWVSLGRDGHRVEGHLAFTVDPLGVESAGKPVPHVHQDKH